MAAFPTDSIGVWSVSFQYLDYGNMQERDNSGALTGSYGVDRFSFGGGWGSKLGEGFSIGLGIQGTRTTLAEVDYTHISSRFGVLWKSAKRFSVGIAYLNQGLLSPGGSSGDAFNLGMSYSFQLDPHESLTALLGGSVEPGAEQYLQGGLEYGLEDLLFLRAGCQKSLQDNALSGLTGLTAGVGAQLDPWRFDYSFTPYGDLGESHRLSLGYWFDGPAPGSPYQGHATLPPGGKNGPVPTITEIGMDVQRPMSPTSSPAVPKVPSAVVTVVATPEVQQPGPKDSLVVQFDLPDDNEPNGQELERQGKWLEALAVYRKAIEKDPKDTVSWKAMGEIYVQLGQKTYAIQCFENVLKLQPDDQGMKDRLERYKNGRP